jgi:glycosyltransferase involved in cell wall biosynthesis
MGERVALVTRFAWPRVGGQEQLVRTLATGLATRHVDVRVYAHRIDEDVIGSKGPLDRSEKWGPLTDPVSGVITEQMRLRPLEVVGLAPVSFSPRRFGPRSKTYAAYLDLIDARARRVMGQSFARQMGTANILHRFGGNQMAAASVNAARSLKVPILITPLAHPGEWDDDPISADAYRRADRVIATCVTDALVYERLGVPSDAIAICPLPTAGPMGGGGAELRRRLKIDGPLILFIGVRRPHKGVTELVDAAALVRRSFPESVFAFVGPGPKLPAEPHGNVLDVGVVGDEERDAWIDASDLVCLPSSSESFGLTISEAWSAHKPVVTSDLPVLKERVESVGGGLAVAKTPAALAEAIKTLLGDTALGKKFGEAGYRYWEETSTPERYAEWHLAEYERVSK